MTHHNRIRRITEDDLHRTRDLIAKSYGALKNSALSLPEQVFRSTEQTIRRYPAGSILMLGIAGGILYGLFRTVPVRTRSGTTDRENAVSSQNGMLRDILVRMIPFLVPYLLAFIRSGMHRIRSTEPDTHMRNEE